jgi:YtoQ family protein
MYLSGEILSDWRERIVKGAAAAGLDVQFNSPVTDHARSDECGVQILGFEASDCWRDQKGAKINAIRTRTIIDKADVVVSFSEKYRQWNAALDAGYASAFGKSIITLHDPGLTHALNEVDAAAQAVCESPEQFVSMLKYVITQA